MDMINENQEKLATMLQDGVEIEYDSAEKNTQVIYTGKLKYCPTSFNIRGIEDYRAAIFVDADGVVDDMSVKQAVQGGAITDSGASGIAIRSKSHNFSGVIVDGGTYEVKDADFQFASISDGSKTCDFDGLGAVVNAFGGAKVTLERVNVYTEGVGRCALFVDNHADVLVKDSQFKVMGGKLYPGYVNTADQSRSCAVPWVLGLTGTARCINMMGACSTATFVGCDLSSNQWGVLSVDSGGDMVLTVVDSTITNLGVGQTDNPFCKRYGCGYGSYLIDSAKEYFYGATFHVGTYAAILRDGDAVYASSRGTYDIFPYLHIYNGRPPELDYLRRPVESYDVSLSPVPVFSGIQGQGRNTVIESDGFGFMTHFDGGSLTILDGTEVNTQNAVFLLKGGSIQIRVDNAKLHANDGILLQVMDDDDAAVGGVLEGFGPNFNREYREKEGYPGIDYDAPGVLSEQRIRAEFTNTALAGDIYNASGYALGGMDYTEPQGRPLELIFGENAAITGIISASSAIHIDEHGKQNTYFTDKEYYYLGHVANKPHYNTANDVSVELRDNAVWTVTGKSLLRSLRVSADAAVKSALSAAPKMTVDGIAVEIQPGHEYTGDIVIEP